MNWLTLGGWRDVVADVQDLQKRFRVLPDTCSCGPAGAHVAGACACCARGRRDLDNGCNDCVKVLASLQEKVDELFDDGLRFLPLIETMAADQAPGETSARMHDVRHAISRVDTVLRKIQTGFDDYKRGCPTSHLIDLKSRAAELGAAVLSADMSLVKLLGPAPQRGSSR